MSKKLFTIEQWRGRWILYVWGNCKLHSQYRTKEACERMKLFLESKDHEPFAISRREDGKFNITVLANNQTIANTPTKEGAIEFIKHCMDSGIDWHKPDCTYLLVNGEIFPTIL